MNPLNRTIVLLANGKYVKGYQYSQGYFDIVTTDDPLEGIHVDDDQFNTFFIKDSGQFCERADPTVVGSKRLLLNVTYTIERV